MGEELTAALEEYARVFDDGFPMIPVAWGRSESEVIKIIKRCLEKGKDAYELGYVKEDLEMVY